MDITGNRIDAPNGIPQAVYFYVEDLAVEVKLGRRGEDSFVVYELVFEREDEVAEPNDQEYNCVSVAATEVRDDLIQARRLWNSLQAQAHGLNELSGKFPIGAWLAMSLETGAVELLENRRDYPLDVTINIRERI